MSKREDEKITEKDAILQTRALEILEKSSLSPVNLSDWKRPIWHSSHGVCRTANGDLVFAKVFPPDLKTNADAEVEKKVDFEKLGIKEIKAPKIITYDEKDLLVVMEVIDAPVMTKLKSADLTKALSLLSKGLVGVREKTSAKKNVPIMKTATQIKEADDMTPTEWAVRDAINWRENIPEREIEFRNRTQRIVDSLSGGLSPMSVWAFGDATPRHFFYQGDHLVYIDFELARRRADLYDLSYFCHRSLTRNEIKPWEEALDRSRKLIKSFVVDTFEDKKEWQSALVQINKLFGLRVIGGFNDLYAYDVGTDTKPHEKALTLWESEGLVGDLL